MKKSNILRIVPFIVLGIILFYTWWLLITTEYSATIKHQIALGLFLINLMLYFFNFKYAVFITGIILLLTTFNLLAFFPELVSSSYFIKIAGKEFSTPSMQGKSLLLMIFYLILNTGFLIDLFKKGL